MDHHRPENFIECEKSLKQHFVSLLSKQIALIFIWESSFFLSRIITDLCNKK